MRIFAPNINKKILPTYFVIELVFAGLFIFYFFSFLPAHFNAATGGPFFVTNKTKSESLLGASISAMWPFFSSKQIYLQYYGRQFNIETDLKTFGELMAILPLTIGEEDMDQLSSLELFDNMEIIIPPSQYQIGMASWYGAYFQGLPTASTEPYNMYELTAAHKTLPLGTKVKITNVQNKKSVIVRINDRGPFVGERIIDLSWKAARQLGILKQGLTTVVIEILE